MYNVRRHLHIYLTKLLLLYYTAFILLSSTNIYHHAVETATSTTSSTSNQTSSAQQQQHVSPSQSSQCQSMWKYPPNCISNCSYHIVWRYNQQDDGIDFIVTTKYAQRWTGVGFSLDRSMINSDAIIAWIEDGSRYVMMDAWMPSYNTPIADQQQNIHNISAATTNGLISFKFSRKRSTGDSSQDLSFTDDKCLYMIYPVSGGNVDIKNRVLLKHETTPIVSQHPICIRSCQYQQLQQQQQPQTQPKQVNRASLPAPPPTPSSSSSSSSPPPPASGTTSTRLRSSGNQLTSPARPSFVNSLLSLQSSTQAARSSASSTSTSTTSTTTSTTTTTTTTPAPPSSPPTTTTTTTTPAPTYTSTTTTTTTTTTRKPSTTSTTTTTTTPAPSSTTTTKPELVPSSSSTTTLPSLQQDNDRNIRQQQPQVSSSEPILTSSSSDNLASINSLSSTTSTTTASTTTKQPSSTTTSTTSLAPSTSTTSTTTQSSLESSSSSSSSNPDIDPNQQWCQGRFAYPINCRFYPSSQTQHLQLPPQFNQLNAISPLPLEHSDCNYYAQWQYLEASDQIEFIIQTKTRNKWTGIGFSNNTRMADSDAIIGLVEENGRHFIMDTWLKDHVMPELDKAQNTNFTSAKRENGTTTVKFRRKRITNDPLDFQFTDDSCAYFFFPVSGGMFNAVNKRLRQHEKIPIISKNRICIKSCTNNAKNSNLLQSPGNNTDNLVTTSVPINEDLLTNTKVPISYNVDNKSPSQDEDGNDLSPSTISTISSNLDPSSGVSTSASTTSNSNVNVHLGSSSTSGPPLDLSADLDSNPAIPSTKASSSSNNPFKKISFLNDSGFRWLAGIGSVAVLILMIMLQACYTVYRNKKTKRQDAINAQWRLAEVAAVQQKVGNKMYNLSGINANVAVSNGTNLGTGVSNNGKLVYDDDIDFDHGDIQRLSRDIPAKDPYMHHHPNNHLMGHNGNNHNVHHQYNGNDLDDPRADPFYDADEYFTNSTGAYLNSNNINDCTTATESSGTEENDGDMMQLQNQDMIMPNSYSLGRHNRLEGNDYISNSHTGHRSHNNRVSGHHSGRHPNNTNHHQHHHHHHHPQQQSQQHYSRSHHHQNQQHNHAGYNGGRGHISRDSSRENYNSNYVSPYPQHQMVAPTNSYTLRHNNGYNNPSTLIRPDSYFLPSQRRYSSTNPPPQN